MLPEQLRAVMVVDLKCERWGVRAVRAVRAVREVRTIERASENANQQHCVKDRERSDMHICYEGLSRA